MPSIRRCELPQGALLGRYQREGAYADCYVTEIPRSVSHAEYVAAFYTTALFKVERRLLAWLIAKPSTDAQASALASGAVSSFAAWSVEARSANELLLTDFQGRTRSWLMAIPAASGRSQGTRLYFGSAVLPVVDASTGKGTQSLVFRLLLGFHKLYSRALLFSAKSRLARLRPAASSAPIAIRSVALLEAFKGLLVLLGGLGILALFHRNVHDAAVELIRHAHLNPASHYPTIFLDAASQINDSRLWLYALGAACYSSLRLVEAYGLWLSKAWAEWLAASSGAIYVPFEIVELVRTSSLLGLLILAVNLLIVLLMLQALRNRTRNKTETVRRR